MSEKLEQVAKAIWENRRLRAMNQHGIELESWGDGSVPRANGVFDEARVAIETMREPTDAMFKAGGIHPRGTYADAWRDMIDCALSRHES